MPLSSSKEEGSLKHRLTLTDIKSYPEPPELYKELMLSPGWPYHGRREQYLCRDRALVALLYLGDFRISEVLPITKGHFKTKEGFIHVEGIKVGKKRGTHSVYRDAKIPLEGPRACFTELVLIYLQTLKADEDRLFPWSLKLHVFTVGSYKIKDGTIKPRLSIKLAGTVRAWQVTKALLPNYTEHWLRAFGYNFDYDAMQHDILAVSDKTKVLPSALQPYLRKRYDKYPVR